MNIAIVGGSFNPPHLCHLFIVQYVLAAAKPDQVWLLPCYQHAFRKVLAPFEHRLAMCHLAIEAFRDDRVKALPFERDRQGTSWTIDTARYVKHLYPHDRFLWVIGSDVLAELHRWKNFEELRQLVEFWVVPRAGMLPAAARHLSQNQTGSEQAISSIQRLIAQAQALEQQGMLLPNISSSQIRERIRQGLPIHHLVSTSVAEYITQHQLYREPEQTR